MNNSLETLIKKVKDYFYGQDKWLYIKHPNLNYISPIQWIKEGKDISVIENLLAQEISAFRLV